MPGVALVAALAVAGVATAVAAVVPAVRARETLGGPEAAVQAADAKGSHSTMLIQFSVKHQKLSHPAEFQEGARKVRRDSPLAKILKRAQRLSKDSGQPFEYLLDVDYIHDANNPLDNRREPEESPEHSDHTEKEPDSTPDPGADVPDRGGEIIQPTRPVDRTLVHHPECVTRADPRVIASTFLNIAVPGTPCVFALDARDEGAHCVMEGDDYGSYGWCYTAQDRSAWGSCSEACPLSGSHALLEGRIDSMSELLDDLLEKVKNKTDCGPSKKKKESKTRSALLEKLMKL